MQISETNQQLRVDRRDTVEQMLHYAEYLAPSDHALLRAVYDRGLSVTEFARAAGCSPQFAQGRLRRLINRINSDAFQFTIRNMRHWPARRRDVANATILHGRSMRDAAKTLGISVHQVRQQLQDIRVLSRNAAESGSANHA